MLPRCPDRVVTFTLDNRDMGDPGPLTLAARMVELIEREFRESRRLVGDGAWLETTMEWRS